MEFKIEKPQHFCAACKRMFSDGEAKVATLTATAEEGTFQRQDYCIDCWSRQNPADFRCSWVTSHTDRRRPALLDADLLWQVLHAAAPEPDGEDVELPVRTATKEKGDPEFAYVAALGLLRLKQLSMDDVRRENTVNWYVFRGRGAFKTIEFLLRDPGLTEADITVIQDRLSDFAERRTKALTSEGTPRGTVKEREQDGGETIVRRFEGPDADQLEAAINANSQAAGKLARKKETCVIQAGGKASIDTDKTATGKPATGKTAKAATPVPASQQVTAPSQKPKGKGAKPAGKISKSKGTSGSKTAAKPKPTKGK